MQQSVYLRYKSKHKLKESLMDRLNIIQRAQYSDTNIVRQQKTLCTKAVKAY